MQLELHGIFEFNDSFDYSDYKYEDDCDTGRFILAIWVPILYSVAMVLGLTGNVLVLVVLWQKRRNWSMTDAFVLHLSIADMLLLLTLPVWAVDSGKGWSFGSGLCKLTGVLFKINFYCSIFLLVCITLNLYISVVHTTQICSRTRPYVVQLICLNCFCPNVIYITQSGLCYSFIEASLNCSNRRGFENHPVLQSYHLSTGSNPFHYAPDHLA
ncbi:hypothetical protein QTP70_003940 [Hemibagrus guttatus]|uniref:G-protein coupled receptors family 1 profile domain-containing protein n=1 Tax=Hemibagrus guttatus TaxID=175788 RepID=A0AAE0RE67_9TELE|nr:hypothetical protein QTP70_003940 [Hemibagrus guttatus]